MKQGKEILEKHLRQMDQDLSPINRLKLRLPAEIQDMDDIYLEGLIEEYKR